MHFAVKVLNNKVQHIRSIEVYHPTYRFIRIKFERTLILHVKTANNIGQNDLTAL